jgi:nucleoside-diphosphate-sugar epimerase
LHAAIQLMEADPSRLKHRNAFNITSMSLEPEILFNQIRKYVPDFTMEYDVDPLRQAIAESWPDMMDDTCAREEWDCQPRYELDTMTKDMIEKLHDRLK